MPSRTEAALCNVGLTFAALAGLLGTAFSQGSRPNETFSVEEYSGVAMGAHIQGHAATTKYAMLLGNLNPTPDAALVPFNPAPNPQIDFGSRVVVNNPYDRTISVALDAYSPAGVLVDQTTLSIPAHGLEEWTTTSIQAFGYGMVVMTSGTPSSAEIDATVGAVATGASRFTNPNAPGLTHRGNMRSWQQLQARQGNTRVHIGPFPFVRGAYRDEINGSYGLGFVMNPNDTANDVRIDVSIDGNYLPPRFATIAPLGSLMIDDVWLQQLANYNSPVLRFGAIVTVTSVSATALPLIAEGFHFDTTAIQSGPTPTGGVPRLASFMGAIEPARLLTASEVTEWTSNMLVNSTLLIANVSASETVVTIAYRDDQANIVATVQEPLGARRTTFVGRGITPGLPNVDMWRYTASIRTSNGAKIIGWSMRAATTQPGNAQPIWGESLLGCNRLEPGVGFFDPDLATWVDPFKSIACWTPNRSSAIDPGYMTFLQETPFAISNYYYYRFYRQNGNASGLGAFQDLPQNFVSFTFEDPLMSMPTSPPPNHHCIISRVNAPFMENPIVALSGIWTTGPELEALALPHWEGMPGVYVSEPHGKK